MIALAEWAARTYHWTLPHLLHGLPAAQLALLFRQWKTAVAGSKGFTLLEEELMARLSARR